MSLFSPKSKLLFSPSARHRLSLVTCFSAFCRRCIFLHLVLSSFLLSSSSLAVAPCPFHITTVLCHQNHPEVPNLNKFSHLIITPNSLYSIVINISSVSTFSEAMNYILHQSALPCSRIDSNTNHVLYIHLTFIACCHVNSSQNRQNL